MSEFKLITYIDRVNFFSENYINYYKKFFKLEEFHFLINHTSYNEIIEYLQPQGFNSTQFEIFNKISYGMGESVTTQNSIKTKFLKQGFIVIYVDIDEIILHPNLRNYIINTNKKHICPKGFAITQNVNENILDTSRKILEQRDYCKYTEWTSKVCILRSDYIWEAGRHNITESITIDDNIFLINLCKVCKKIMKENNIITNKLYHNNALSRYLITDDESINNMYKNTYLVNLTKIPKLIKDINLF